MANISGNPAILPTQICDIEFHSVIDAGFFGEYSMTPVIHSHPYYELIAAVSGSFEIELADGKIIQMHAGTVCCVPPLCYHSTTAYSEHSRKLAVRFSYNSVKIASGGESLFTGFDTSLSGITNPIVLDSEPLCSIMLSIRDELHEQNTASDVLVQSLMMQLYVNFLRLIVNSYTNLDSSGDTCESDYKKARYYQIEIYLSDNYSKQITEDNLARELMLSKRQVSRILRDIYNMSFREKLIETRMQIAAKLLSRTDIPVEKIAFMVGYTSASGFYVTFMRKFGISGVHYRNQSRAADNEIPE